LGAGKFAFAVDQGDNHAAADPALEGRLALNEQDFFVIQAVLATGLIPFELLENWHLQEYIRASECC
jgi:hypothetical protein